MSGITRTSSVASFGSAGETLVLSVWFSFGEIGSAHAQVCRTWHEDSESCLTREAAYREELRKLECVHLSLQPNRTYPLPVARGEI